MPSPHPSPGDVQVVLAEVEALPARAAAAGHVARAAGLAAAMLADGADPGDVAAALTALADALVRRLLAAAAAELGPAPAPWAWLALGSQGRSEQTLGSDRDDALVYGDAGAGRRAWFVALAERVGSELEAAGVPPCRGGHVASHLHGTIAEWETRLEDVIRRPDPHAAELLLDLRRVAGDLSTEPLDAVLATAGRWPTFLSALARQALMFSPPSPLLLWLRARRPGATFDVKRWGLLPITALARCHAAEAGSTARGTAARLAAARGAGLLDADAASALLAAHRLLLRLRLEQHLRASRAGAAPSDRVALRAVSAGDRRGLIAAAAAVKRWQAQAAYHYQVER